MADTALYAEIVKAERNDDGDLVVVGKASGPDLDLDQQICDPGWLSKAMPEWMSTGGNLREQHSSIAAGVATELSQSGENWMVAGLIVDPVSARKVEKRVLKGFSVGIKNPQVVKDAAAPGGRVVGGSVVEVSLVDRPANPTCTLMLAKAAGADAPLEQVEELHEGGAVPTPKDLAKSLNKNTATEVDETTETPAEDTTEQATAEPDQPKGDTEQEPEQSGDGSQRVTVEVKGAGLDSDEIVKRIVAELSKRQFTQAERDDAADKNQALPDGSFPIKSVADLKNAIQAIGRAKDPAKAKAHIKARAKALGKESLIPEGWKAADADLTKADGEQTHDPAELKTILSGLVDVMKAELDEMVDGEDEICDVEQLLCSVRLFTNWWSSEAADGETDPPFTEGEPQMAYVGLSADADTTKTVGSTEETSGPDGPDDSRLTELVKSAVADAMTASEERIKALEADLQKALALPEPGGPVLTRTAHQEGMARKTDAVRLESEANELLRKAEAATDQYLAKGYRDRARDLLEKAAA